MKEKKLRIEDDNEVVQEVRQEGKRITKKKEEKINCLRIEGRHVVCVVFFFFLYERCRNDFTVVVVVSLLFLCYPSS
jgi:hypothetical protein